MTVSQSSNFPCDRDLYGAERVIDLALLAVLFGLTRVIMVTIEINHFGIGRHIWDIPGKNFPQIWHIFDIEDMVYCFAILCAKLSILSFYLTIFGINKTFRWAVYATMTLTTLYLLVSFFTYVFHCGVRSWEGTQTNCLDGITQEIAIGGFNIATDLTILLLPLPQLWGLQLNRSRKIGLFIVFLLGSFTLVATIVREVFAITTLSTVDQSWNTSDVVVWKTVEMCVGVICSNLLTGPFILRYLVNTPIGSSIHRYINSNFGGSAASHTSQEHFHKHSSSYDGSERTINGAHGKNIFYPGPVPTEYFTDLEHGRTFADAGTVEDHTQLDNTEGIQVNNTFTVDAVNNEGAKSDERRE